MKINNWIKNNQWLLLILSFAAFLRLYRVDFQSIWLDEIHTMNESNPETKLSELYDAIMTGEQMPPLYFYIFLNIFIFFSIIYSLFLLSFFNVLFCFFQDSK